MSGPGLFQSAPPDVAIAIDGTQIAAARVAGTAGALTIAAHAALPLPPGTVTPALIGTNIHDVSAVGRRLGELIAQLGGRVRRAALVLPDTVAKVSLVKFETVPPRAADLLELVRWQIRKSAPFPLEQAVVSYTVGHKAAEGGQEFVVSVARTDVIAQYEHVCEAAGVHAGLVDLATFSLINGALASNAPPAGDWLLVHAAPTYTTVAVMRGRDILFFRNRVEESEGSLADIVHQTAMYYEDRLNGSGFQRVLLAGTGHGLGASDLRPTLEDRLRVPIESVDPRQAAALTDHAGATPELLETLAPLVGVLLRERKAA